MTPSEFAPCMEADLALRGVEYDQAELSAWLESMWPWISEEPDVGMWAGEFIEARAWPE